MPSTEYLERKDEKRKAREQEQTKKRADIGDLHAVVHPNRRHLCSWNLGLWLQTYFPESTGRGVFSESHYDVIDSLESCFIHGGWYCNLVFREFAKTSICEGTVLWALMNGHRRFVPIFGAAEGPADEILDSMLMELNQNDLLWEDFPEICVAFRHLEGKWQKAESQTFMGERTYISQSGGDVIFPTIRLTPEMSRELKIPINQQGFTINSGGIFASEPLLSAKRGKKHKRPDGTQQRPDAAIVDDPQTDRSAESAADISKRLRVIRKAIIPMSGQRKKMALVVNATPIAANDVPEQLMDRKLSPGFQGRRIPMLQSRASEAAEKLWLGPYARIFTTWNQDDAASQQNAYKAATAYYEANRLAMDDGAKATWHTCFNKDEMFEVSAIQHAYNIMIEQGEDIYASECDMRPKRIGVTNDDITLAEIIGLANGIPRGVAPVWADRAVVQHDVQDNAVYWVALATGKGFRSHVMDYGMYPEQLSGSMLYEDVKIRLRDVHNGSMEAALQTGLKAHIQQLYSDGFQRQDGVQLKLPREQIGVDSGDNTTSIYQVARSTGVVPTKGRGLSPKQTQWVDFPDRVGEEINREYHWLIGATRGSKELRLFQYETDWWKSFTLRRIRTPANDFGSLSLFGTPQDQVALAMHCVNEYQKGSVWLAIANKNNHLWDCLVGAHAISSRFGASLLGVEIARPATRTTVRFSDLQRQKGA